jgi:hypothetical protein
MPFFGPGNFMGAFIKPSLPPNARLLENNAARTLEDGTVRMLES